MSPTRIEFRPEGDDEFFEIDKLHPGDQSVAIPVTFEGGKSRYRAYCSEEDTETLITKEVIASPVVKRINNFANRDSEPEKVAVLKRGEIYEVSAATAHNKGTVRITHI